MRVFGLFVLLFAVNLQAWAVDTRPRLVLNIGHTAQVNCLLMSPDNALLASGGADGTAKLWDAKTHSLRFSLPHDAPVLAVGFAGNRTLVTAAADQSLYLYNTATGTLNAERIYGNGLATAAAIAPGGARAAWGFADGKIFVREIASGKTIPLAGHPTRILALAFSPDGKTLASCSDAYIEKPTSDEFARRSGDLRLWDTADGERVKTLVGHALGVRGAAWSPDGKRLASIGDSGTAVLWDANSFAKLNEFNVTEGKGRANCVGFSPDGSQLAVGWRGDCRVWAVTGDSGRPVRSTALHGTVEARKQWASGTAAPNVSTANVTAENEPVTAVAFETGGEVLAGREGTVQFHSFASAPARSGVSPLRAMRLSPDGSLIATGDAAGVARLWRAADGSLLRAWRADALGVADLAFAPDGSQLVLAGGNGLSAVDPQDAAKQPAALALRPLFAGASLHAVAFSADGKRLFVAGRGKNEAGQGIADNEIGLWNVADKSLVRKYFDFAGTGRALRATADDSLAAACGRGDAAGEVLRWDATGKLLSRTTLRGARTVALSPDGKRLLAGGAFLDENQDYAPAGDVLQGWNLRSGEQTIDLMEKAENGSVMSSAFSADGTLLITGSRDGAVRIWDMGPEKHLLKTLRGHSGPVIGVAFVPAGAPALLYSAGSDGSVRCWRLSDGREMASMIALSENVTPRMTAPETGPLVDSNWVTVTPEGYFQGSPGASRLLSWRIGNDVFPVSAFEGAFRRSDNVAAALAGNAVPDANFGQGHDIPPLVAITQPLAGGTAADPVQVQVAATGAKNLQSLQLLVNGRIVATKSLAGTGGKPLEVGAKPLEVGAKPLEVGAKPLEVGAKALEVGAKALEVGAKPLEVGAKPLEVGAKAVPSAHDREWDVNVTAPLPVSEGGALTLKAIVTDGDGLQAADEIRLKRSGAAGAGGTLYILSVGVSHYANPKYNLNFAAADAIAFGAMWSGGHGALFQAVKPLVLTDTGATSKAVAAALGDIARQAGPDDVVALFLSGHGVQKADGAFYFASHDINLTDLDNTAVPWTLLKSSLASSKARRLVMFLDACHSGAALGASQAGGEAMAEDLVKGAGAVVFASSLGRQYSYENAALGHGAFTQALMEGIGAGKADLDAGTGKDGVINVEELLTYLRARVPELTGGAQLPACPLLRDFGEPFPLARAQ